MNKVVLIGRLTRDPEIRTSQSGISIARYTLAVDRRRGRNSQDNGQQTADFISCVAFDRQAEFAEKYLHKGSKMAVIGRIQTGSYTNRDGQKVYTTDVVIEEQEFAESRSAASAAGSTPAGQAQTTKRNANAAGDADEDGFVNVPDALDDTGLSFN